MADDLLEELEPESEIPVKSTSIHSAAAQSKPRESVILPQRKAIPPRLKRWIHARAGNRCEFTRADGPRCDSRMYLEIDHIQPVAKGGTNDPENLRVLCRTHNQAAAIRALSPALMRRYLPRTRS